MATVPPSTRRIAAPSRSRATGSLTRPPITRPSWRSHSTCSRRLFVRLEGEAWSRYFQDFAASAFRLELRQVYTMPDEEEDLLAFQEGLLPPPGYHYGWLDTVAEAKRQGKTMRRVRIVTRPLSFYTQWEFAWGFAWNVKAGEDIRILDVTEQAASEMPDHDFWL